MYYTETILPDSNFILEYLAGKYSLKPNHQLTINVVDFVRQDRKKGVWTETIRFGVDQNIGKVAANCCSKKAVDFRYLIILMRKNLQRFANIFVLEGKFNRMTIDQNKVIAKSYFSGPTAESLIKMGDRPQDHDYTILAEAMFLKNKYDNLTLYSYDKHFVYFRAEIEKVTGIQVVDCNY
jgi:hypothetical protein